MGGGGEEISHGKSQCSGDWEVLHTRVESGPNFQLCLIGLGIRVEETVNAVNGYPPAEDTFGCHQFVKLRLEKI